MTLVYSRDAVRQYVDRAHRHSEKRERKEVHCNGNSG